MVTTYVVAGIIAVIIIAGCIWVTSKAYSRKWDE